MIKTKRYENTFRVFVINSNLYNMSMKWIKGRTTIREFPRTSSTTFTKNSLVYFVSGLIAPADATAGDIAGICIEDVASTDSDFATAAVPIKVEVAMDRQCVLEADVTGTLVTTSVGVTYDLSTALVVDQAASSKDVVTCVKFISATKGQFVLNSTFDVFRTATS